jgi:hypothetical protein
MTEAAIFVHWGSRRDCARLLPFRPMTSYYTGAGLAVKFASH